MLVRGFKSFPFQRGLFSVVGGCSRDSVVVVIALLASAMASFAADVANDAAALVACLSPYELVVSVYEWAAVEPIGS